MPKFLIIRFSSIGDIVLTSPVTRCLKQQVNDAEVHFLTKEIFRSLVEHNPNVDKVHVLAHSWELLLEELKTENYDYIIDLHHNARSLIVKSALRKKSFSVNKLKIKKHIYTIFKLNILPQLHVVDRYMKTVESFGVKNDGEGLDHFVPKSEEIKKNDIPASHSAGFIACSIGGGHGTKKWPVHKWKEFCKKMDHPIVILGGNEDAADGAAIAAIDDVKVYNACGKFSINESADIVRHAKLVITNDTGLMHIGAAFRKPVISLWGNTVPAFGMYPYYGNRVESKDRYDLIQVNNLWCRPCSRIGYNKCPLGHFKCMENISVDRVLERARQRLQ